MADAPDKNDLAWPPAGKAKAIILLAVTAVLVLLCLLLVTPFFPAVTWAASLAIAAFPLHRAIEKRIGRPNLSAAVSVLLVGALIVVPVILIAQSAVDEVLAGTEHLRSWVSQSQQEGGAGERDPRISRVLDIAGPYIDVKAALQRLSEELASAAPVVVVGSATFLAQVLIGFFILFFLFRDRLVFLRKIKRLLPLTQSEADKLFFRIGQTVEATIYGTFGVSLIQGILGGLIFWWLGLPAPALWGAVMFLLSLVPVLGAPVVWVPIAVFLAATGNWGQALILTGWGMIVIGSIDNIVYPILVGDRVRMHTLTVFISAVGGIALIGPAGLVLGPVIVVAADALVEFWRDRLTQVDGHPAST